MLLNNKSLLLSLMLFLIMNSGQVTAKMYKWVDKNGATHYSQHPPPNDPAQEIKKNYTEDEDNIEKLQQAREEKMDAFNKRRQERLDKKKQAKKEKEEKKKLNIACEKARSKLQKLMLDRQVRKKVGDEYIMMTDEQRKKDIAELKKKISAQCK